MESINNKGLRILALSSNFPNPLRPYEGTWAYTQFKALTEYGAEVKVLSPRVFHLGAIKKYSDVKYAFSRPKQWTYKNLEVYGPKVFYWLAGNRFRHTYPKQYYRGIKKTVDEIYNQWPFDAIYTQALLPDAYAAVRLARRYGITSSGCVIGEGEVTDNVKNPAIRKLVVDTLNQMDLVVAESHTVADHAMQLLDSAKDVYGIHRGSFPEDLIVKPEITEKWRQKFNFPPETIIIMYVGHLYRAKGVLDLLEAFQKVHKDVPNARLLYMGTGDQEEILEKRIQNYNLKEEVRLIGAVPFDHVPSLMVMADFICSPSHKEGLGLVNVEAGFCGRAVLGARTGGIPEAICDGKTGLLFAPGNVNDLIEKMKILLGDKDMCKKMGAEARKFVAEHHDAHKNTRRLYELIAETVNKKEKRN